MSAPEFSSSSAPVAPSKPVDGAEALRARLEAIEASLRTLERLANVGRWTVDLRTGEAWWSEQFYAILGRSPEEAPPGIAQGLEWVHPEDRARARLAFEAARDGGEYVVEKRIVRPDGQVRFVESRGEVERDTNGEPARMVGSLQDITERKEAELALQRLAVRDDLTGAYNRRYAMQRLHDELGRARRYAAPLSIAVFDADHFKDINDRHGHATGDAALRHLVTTVLGVIRQSDVLARVGGEEFLLILPETAEKRAFIAAEKVRRAVELSSLEVDGQTIRFTVSAGLASLNPEISAPQPVEASVPPPDLAAELLRRADDALYRAKDSGRNRVCA